jgi:very-short-patch-repair endonuclease
MAAVLALGDGALLSHTSAGALWDLRQSASGRTHVTVPGAGNRTRRSGIIVHRSPFAPGTTHRGIPVTTPAQTILDLSTSLGVARRVVDRSVQLRLFDLAAVEALLVPGRRGVANLRRAIAEHDDAPTRSELERCFLRLCRDHGIPRPRVNDVVCGLEVDFCWPRARLIVETDGARHHATRTGMENDRQRDAVLALAGWRVQRFTWRQVTGEPATVAAVVRALLGR